MVKLPSVPLQIVGLVGVTEPIVVLFTDIVKLSGRLSHCNELAFFIVKAPVYVPGVIPAGTDIEIGLVKFTSFITSIKPAVFAAVSKSML